MSNGMGGSLKGRKVLVTGASGFIGARLVAALLSAQAEVSALGRNRHSAAALAGLGVRVVMGDMADPQAQEAAVEGQEFVFNLAYDFRASGAANLAGFEGLVAAAERLGRARIIHTSSIVVYDDWPNGAVSEASAMDRPGGSPYRRTKIAMERRLMAGSRPAAIVQPTIVYGPGSSLWTDGFAEGLLSGAVVLPEPEGLCQGIFVEDVVQGLLRAATLPDLGRERFILNGPAPFAWSALIGGYRDILGQGEVRFRPAAELAPTQAHSDAGEDGPPSVAARISAIARRMIGHQRFEALVRAAKRCLKAGGEMRPDAHLYELFVAQGACPADLARQRLGYAPAFGLAEGLAATAAHLRGLAG